ncbi:MAG: polysaccharide deacetylase [Crocinitomicaceae bacterium]|nr:polysaccharide deacetylase [Crocinitomicaceae bacterium]|tara:strand:+ start:8857 stop:9633 length:777 start_codon:yes stop_codon:yes gene_type:complete
MSAYVRKSIAFWASTVVLVVFLVLNDASPFWVIIPILIFGLYVTYNSFHIEQNFFLESIVSGKPKKKGIAITFDDGPNNTITPKVLALLDKYNAKASFFCIGKNAEEYKEILQQIDRAGHTIGSHSFSHDKWIDFLFTKKWINEIELANNTIESIIGKRPRFFRPPYGVTTYHLAKAIKRTKMLSIGWNIRSLDTMNNNVLEIVNRSTENLKDGCIVLFHDNLDWSCDVLEEFLIRTQKLGLQVVPLPELIEEKAYED